MTNENKQVQRTHSPQGRIYLGVSSGVISHKVVDTPQTGAMRETGEAGPTHVGVQHTSERIELDHISPDPQWARVHTVDGAVVGTAEGSGCHN